LFPRSQWFDHRSLPASGFGCRIIWKGFTYSFVVIGPIRVPVFLDKKEESAPQLLEGLGTTVSRDQKLIEVQRDYL
jgi:hypothetical protein